MWAQVTSADIAIGVALFVVTIGISTAVMVAVLLRLPPDHLIAPPAALRPRGARGWLRKIGKNLLGGLLVLIGVGQMPMPGLPGQGTLTAFAGVLLLDFPGKHRIERKLLGRPRVLRTLNRLRARFDLPPLVTARSLAGLPRAGATSSS